MEETQNNNQPTPNEAPVAPVAPAPESTTSSAPTKGTHKLLIIIGAVVIGLIITAVIGIVASGALVALNPVEKMNKAKEAAALSTSPEPTESVDTSSVDTTIDTTLLEAAPYTDKINGFSINQPKGWTKANAGTGVLVAFANPQFKGNTISVLSESTQGLTLKDYVDASLVQLPKQIPGYTFTDKKDITLGTDPAYVVGGEFTQQGINIKNKQYIVVKNGKAYIVTATSTKDNWAPYQKEIESSLNSFRAY